MFTLREIVDITNGKPVSLKAGLIIRGISTDSRTIKKGELFVALLGEHFKGSSFVSDARRKGACGAIVPEGVKPIPDFPLIEVKDTKEALGSIAKVHRDRFNIPIIAITGSNGKTTTKDMIAQILNKRFKVLKTDKTENNKIGVAHTLLKLKDQDIAVIEVGTSSHGEIKYHSDILRPDVALITNIGPSHLEGLKDAKGVLREKLALVESLGREGVWIKNSDDEMLSRENPRNIKVLTYGIKKKRPYFKAQSIRQTKSGIEFRIKVSTPAKVLGSSKRKATDAFADAATYAFTLPLFGIHNVYNALAAIAACSLFVEIETMQKLLSSFRGSHMRMQVLNTDSFTIIDDSYNSNPLSFRCAVSALKDYPASGRRIVVCADMLELGEGSERMHYESGQLLAEEGIDLLITFGEKSYNIAKGALDNGMDKDRVTIFREKDKIATFLHSIISKGDVILIKGSRGMKMEEVCNCFTTYSTR